MIKNENDMNRIKFFVVALVMTVMLLPVDAMAGSNDNTRATRRERREMVKNSIRDALRNAKCMNADSVSMKVATVMTDEFSDTLFEWENPHNTSEQSDTDSKYCDDSDDLDGWESAVVLGVLFMIFGAPVMALIIIVWIIAWYSTRKNRERDRVVAMAVERGIPLPPDYFRASTAKSRLQSGLVWVMWGIGIAIIFLLVSGARTAVVLGLIPFLVGSAKLITYFIEDRPNKRD